MPAVCLVNGREGRHVDPLDRGLQYGDGVFRTLRIDNGQPRWWDEQLAKLAADAQRLGIPVPDAALWRADLAQLDGRLAGGVLKLLLTRGRGARGYRASASTHPTRMMSYDDAAIASDAWPATGLSVRLCALRLSEQPLLAGIKHLNRLENVLARAEWTDPEIHEGILCDAAGRVISGVMSNLFLWRDGRLLTPRLHRCGISGVTRARLLRQARETGMAVEEADFGLDLLLAADELMLCNSVIGLRRVARLDTRIWPQPMISTQLRERLDG